MKSLRLLVMTINVITAVVVVLIVAIAWFVNSESGARRAVAFAAARLPGGLEVGRIEGTLADGLILHDLVLRPGSGLLTVERVGLSWSASSLLARSSVLNDVAAHGVVYARGSEGANVAAARRWREPPFPIVVRGASIDGLSLRYGEASQVFAHTALSGRWVGRQIVVDELRSESSGVAFTGRGEVVLADPLLLSVEMSWAGDAAGMRAAGTLRLAGSPPTLELDHELILPIDAAASGELELNDTGSAEAELVVETEHGSFAGVGAVSLAATEWDLTMRPLEGDSARQFPEWPESDDGRGRFAGRLLPQLEWSLSAVGAETALGAGETELRPLP